MDGGTPRNKGGGDMGDDIELTPEEKMAFDNLPREASPSEFLEERIVRALRKDGTLRGSTDAGRRLRPWVVAVASMAASVVLFGSGLLLGQWMGARNAEQVLLAVREQDEAQVAQRIQEAGSAYVTALVALGKLRAGVAEPSAQAASEIRQGREVALGALYGAVVELARITPGDPHISQLLQILEERKFQETGIVGARKTVWF
jgi:hypothetical protein